MSAAVTNPFSLTWGAFTVGGTTERLITGLHRLSRSHSAFEVTCDVLIRGTTDAGFAAACAEMESEFSKRRLDFAWKVGTETIEGGSHSGNTGFNGYARIDKVGTRGADTDRSRLYTITVGCELPSTDTDGRRDSSVVVEYDPSQRRTVTISGVWTAVAGTAATANYLARIDAYCSSVLGGLTPSATFESVNGKGRMERDDQDKVVRFTRVYREILANQSTATLDNTGIVDPVVTFQRLIDQPGDSGTVRRVNTIAAHFEAQIDKTVTLDLKALYEGTVRPFILAEFVAGYRPSDYGVVSEAIVLARYTNTLSVDLTIRALIDATELLESVEATKIVEDPGIVLTGAWTGKLYDKYVDQGHATRLKFEIRALKLRGRHRPVQRVNGITRDGPWVLKANESQATVKTIGQPGGPQYDETDIIEQLVWEYVTTPSEGGTVETPRGDPSGPDETGATPPPPAITPNGSFDRAASATPSQPDGPQPGNSDTTGRTGLGVPYGTLGGVPYYTGGR